MSGHNSILTVISALSFISYIMHAPKATLSWLAEIDRLTGPKPICVIFYSKSNFAQILPISFAVFAS